MAKKNSKQKEKLITGERQFGVILEDIDSKLDLVVEGHKALDEKIDKNHGEFQEFKKEVDYKFGVVFEHFEQVDRRFEQVDRCFEQVDQRFEQVDQRLEGINDELRLIRNELKEKVGRDEFAVLEKKVSALEKRLAKISG